MSKKKKPIHYVNNKELYGVMCEYIKKCKEAEECEDPRPKVPEYVGSCITKIAYGLASKPNFSGYSYKDDMIGDGIEVCIRYIHNFNPEKSTNPFSYFSQIIYFAFLQRITKEKKQALAKAKIFRNNVIMDDFVEDDYKDYFTNGQHAFDIDDERIAELEESIKPAGKRKKNK